MTTAEFFFGHLSRCLKKPLALLVTDCERLYDAIHKDGAALSSTDKRLAIELAIVKFRKRERGEEGFVRKRVRAKHAEATSFLEECEY